MDFIAQQVKLLIEQKEKKASSQAALMQPREGVGVSRGRGRLMERNYQAERKPGKVSHLCSLCLWITLCTSRTRKVIHE